MGRAGGGVRKPDSVCLAGLGVIPTGKRERRLESSHGPLSISGYDQSGELHHVAGPPHRVGEGFGSAESLQEFQ